MIRIYLFSGVEKRGVIGIDRGIGALGMGRVVGVGGRRGWFGGAVEGG